jgi:acyl-CoA thioester hydrolase
LQSAIEEIGSKSIVFQHQLVRAEQDVIAVETKFRCVLLELESRRAVEIPDDVREKAQAFLLEDA